MCTCLFCRFGILDEFSAYCRSGSNFNYIFEGNSCPKSLVIFKSCFTFLTLMEGNVALFKPWPEVSVGEQVCVVTNLLLQHKVYLRELTVVAQ